MSKQNIYNRLTKIIGNPYGVCGLMGNIQSESAFNSKNMQNSYETRLGMNDATYTAAVDNNSYINFAVDKVGYGLCQWTSSGRKTNLLNFAKGRGASIGDENMQIDFIEWELNNGYKSTLKKLKNATSVKEASDYVCKYYERPADQSTKALAARQAKGEAICAEFCTVKEDARMTNLDFVQKLKDIANNHKTLYVMGCFGAPMNDKNKARYTTNHSYNKKSDRTKMINAASADTFGFDCVCLIKGVLWGWSGDTNKTYGGATYISNNVPDIGADLMIQACSDLSTDFSKIELGEVVWMKGHVGVYIGDGLAVECSPKWKNCVQITACNRTVSGHNRRNWTKHGKLPYLKYVEVKDEVVKDEVVKEPETTTQEECKVTLPQLEKGIKGDIVKTLQILLIGRGYSCGDSGVDGSFGKATRAAVLTFQKDNSLKEDGIVGINTWSKLLAIN